MAFEERSPGMVIAAVGQEGQKAVNGKIQRVIPFVGADRPEEFASFGVGIMQPDLNTAQIWGLVMPHKLIQSWRAMKLLEHAAVIEDDTLCNLYYAGGREVSSWDSTRIEKLGHKLGRERFAGLRAGVLQQAPSAEELGSMLTILKGNQVGVDGWELQQEIELGLLAPHPLSEELIKNQEARRLAHAESMRALPPQLSSEQQAVVARPQVGNSVIQRILRALRR